MRRFFLISAFLFASLIVTDVSASVTDAESTDLPVREGKRSVYFRVPEDKRGAKQGELVAVGFEEFARNKKQAELMERAVNPLLVSQILEMNGVRVLPVQITFHPVELEMFAAMKNMPPNMFLQMPSPRRDTYFVVADSYGTQENFIRTYCQEDPRVLEVSILCRGNIQVFSTLSYEELCTRYSNISTKLKLIELQRINQGTLERSTLVNFDCGIAGAQLVRSPIVGRLVHTTNVCDCLCLCARSPSQQKGLMAHINHDAIKRAKAGEKATDYQNLIKDLSVFGDDLEIQIVSSYLSAPLDQVALLLSRLFPRFAESKNSIHCLPIVFEREPQGVRTIADMRQLPWDLARDILGRTSGGLTVLFDVVTGEISTEITRITPDEKARRVF